MPRIGRASVNLSFAAAMATLSDHLPPDADVLLVGAGGQRSAIAAALRREDVTIVATDIDPESDVDVICDATTLPFADGSFDGVVSTAVLEHVTDPTAAVAEIARVLRSRGLVYTEVPFMQQVHEGAYDFTRYTMAGHRRLMRAFDELGSGAVAGPATALVWSLEHFALALVGSRRRLRPLAKATVRLLLGWIAVADRWLAPRPAGLDAASCTWFLGRRRDARPVGDAEVVAGYRGAQTLVRVTPPGGAPT
jgi:SAM-dependent methyltransferase